MARPGRSGAYEDPAAALSAAAELLAVLHARGQDGVEPAVSPSQLRALLAVEGAEGINLRTLSDVLGSRPPSVTRLCDRLEAMGLLIRSPRPSSRREVELRLTPRGRALLDERRAIRMRELSAVLGRMAPEAVDALIAGLTAFRAAAAADGPPAGTDTSAAPASPGPRATSAPARVPDSA
ncbi:MarR family winged helix-turn-helix transcriptional regulator [Streptomyces erythrochromogenes]|uniref:MarR family winged helix-turn-helix transcriptional regulator n=1 Tax=Streptomyces erythrochromogenes TaxID=285574 RepID=UPI00224EBCE9|nr:MarR family transcriptional regulator [Streptomyces erythrochromogenes]MCX5588787.1 MarR family transcriptional regulator [Streptomyces erythrochromogenes]